jgi:hypothetical protein
MESSPLSPPDPQKILDIWMEWERGEAGEPGMLISRLKTAGLPILLQEVVDERAARA